MMVMIHSSETSVLKEPHGLISQENVFFKENLAVTSQNDHAKKKRRKKLRYTTTYVCLIVSMLLWQLIHNDRKIVAAFLNEQTSALQIFRIGSREPWQ
jgi:hypothetical protein